MRARVGRLFKEVIHVYGKWVRYVDTLSTLNLTEIEPFVVERRHPVT